MTQHATVPGPDGADPQDDDDPTPDGASFPGVPRPSAGDPAGRAVVATDDVATADLTAAARRTTPRSVRPDGRRAPDRGRRRVPGAVLAWHERGRRARTELREAGMATAEYAIATLAAVGFAGLLVVILKGNEVKGLLLGIIRQALSS